MRRALIAVASCLLVAACSSGPALDEVADGPTVSSVPGSTGPSVTAPSLVATIEAKMSAANRVNTAAHLSSMSHSSKVDVHEIASDVYAFSSGMAIDTDGSDPDPDADHQNQTTWRASDGRSLGAHHVPYYVLGDICPEDRTPCPWFYYGDHHIEPLQFALIMYRGRAVGAVFGDTQGPPGGDPRELGEASAKTAELLGIPSNGDQGGVPKGVTYVIFAGPAWVVPGDNATLNDNAQALVPQAVSQLTRLLGQ